MSDLKQYDFNGIPFGPDNPKEEGADIYDENGNLVDEGAVYPTMNPDKEPVTFVADHSGRLLPEYETAGHPDVESEKDRIIGERVEKLRVAAWIRYDQEQVDMMAAGLEKDLRRLSPSELFRHDPKQTGSDYEAMHSKICGRLGADITSSEGKRKADEMDMRYPSMASPAAKERTFSRAVGLID